MTKPTTCLATRSQSGAQRDSNIATTTVNSEKDTQQSTDKRKTKNPLGRPKKKS